MNSQNFLLMEKLTAFPVEGARDSSVHEGWENDAGLPNEEEDPVGVGDGDRKSIDPRRVAHDLSVVPCVASGFVFERATGRRIAEQIYVNGVRLLVPPGRKCRQFRIQGRDAKQFEVTGLRGN